MTTTQFVQPERKIPGVQATLTVALADLSALGEHVAQLSADEQADFLAGFALAYRAMNPRPAAGLMQMQCLADALAIEPDSAAIVRWLLTELDGRIDVPDAA